MKTLTSIVIFAVCLSALACSRIYGPVQEAKALMEAKDEILTEWGKILKAEPNEAGLEKARKYFEGKKSGLIAKREAVKNAPQGMNADWRSMLAEHESRTSKALLQMQVELATASSYDTSQKFKPLAEEFEDTSKRY